MQIIKKAFAESVGVPEPSYAISNIGTLLQGLVNASIVLGALAAFIFLILGGFQWITSGGDKAKTEEAQKKITNAVIGLIVIAAAYALINLITTFLFGQSISELSLPSLK